MSYMKRLFEEEFERWPIEKQEEAIERVRRHNLRAERRMLGLPDDPTLDDYDDECDPPPQAA